MDAAAANPDPIDGAKRAYLRPFVLRAAWAAILTGALAILLLLVLVLVLEPAGDLLQVLDNRLTLKAWLIVFWTAAGATLVGVLMSGIVAAAHARYLFGPEPLKAARGELGWLRSTRIWGAMALLVFLAALALPLRSVTDDSSYYEILPNNTPAETIQFFFYLIAGGIAVTLVLNHRAMLEIQRTLVGDESTRPKAAFEVLMPQAKATFSSQPIVAQPLMPAAPLSESGDPAALQPIVPGPGAPLPIAAPSVAVAFPHAASLQTVTGSSEDGGSARNSDRLFAAVLLMALALTVTHLWTLYALRNQLKETQMWERTYLHYTDVPQDPRISATNPSVYPPPPRYNVSRRGGWNSSSLPKRNEPLAGLAAVAVLGGSFLNMALQVAVALWATICIISGRRLRSFGEIIAWLMLVTIGISSLAHIYLAQQFKFAPDQLAELTFFRNVSDGEFREITRLMSPMDVSVRQLVIPLAMLMVLSERAGRLLRGGGGRA